MRAVHAPHVIQFRASDQLAHAIYSRAEDAGVSVSEYLRTIARQQTAMPAEMAD